jgi:high-affinity Fe2+/Pb2+ permease
MELIPLIALFIIVWFIFGGLRSPFGKVLMIFSVLTLIVIGGFVIYALNSLPKNNFQTIQAKPLDPYVGCENSQYRTAEGGC